MTISFARPRRIAGIAVTALVLTGGLAGTASAVTVTRHAVPARALAQSPAARNAMCLDAGRSPRRHGGLVIIWRCEAGNSNQAWVIDGGQVRVRDTIGTAAPMCLDAGRSPRRNGGLVTIWRCQAGNSNQAWVLDGGQIQVKDTLA